MNKSTIRVVIAALVIVTIGIGLFIGGILAAGGVSAAKEVLGNNGIGWRFDEAGFGFQIGNEKKTNSYTRFSKYDVDNLVIDAGTANILISEKFSQEDIGVYVKEGNFDVKLEDETLYIESNAKVKENQLELYLPADFFFEEVGISVGASTMEIEGLTAEVFHAEIGAGEIIMNDGNIKECSVDVGMGNFEYEGLITGNCDFDCGMGNIELQLEGEKENFNYEIDCAAGNVTVGNESFGGIASDREIDYGADAAMDIDCGMGNVTIDF